VGHQPPAFAFVRGANGGRGEQIPFRIEPDVGKVTEDSGKSSEPNKSGDVFQQHETRSHLADDLEALGPEPVLAVNSGPPPRGREVGAGEAGSNDIHSATPRCAVEGGDVIPDRA